MQTEKKFPLIKWGYELKEFGRKSLADVDYFKAKMAFYGGLVWFIALLIIAAHAALRLRGLC